MRSIAPAITYALVVLAGGTPSLAQSVETGTRVRIKLNSGESALTGTLREVRGDTLVLERDVGSYGGRSWAVASEVKTMERSVGRKSQLGAGAFTGVITGAAIGAVIGFTVGSDADSSCPQNSACELLGGATKPVMARAGALTGGLLGLIVGSLIGSTMSTDRWQAVEAADHPTKIGLRSAGMAGARAGVSVAFGSAPRR